MTIETIQSEFRQKVCEQVRVESEGLNRYRIFTPFVFADGDHLAIVLRHEDNTSVLSDEGHTYMHLTYSMDESSLQKGTREKVITNALDAFSVEDRDGELRLRIEGDRYGDSLFSFIQALLKIMDVRYLSREQVRSTFLDDFRALMSSVIPESRRTFDWHDPQNDPEGKYLVDCRVNGMPKPVYVFALPNDDETRDATIAMLNFERWHHGFHSVAVFEEQESVNRKVLARFSDICEKQFSTMTAGNRERITKYLEEAMQ